MRTMSGCRSRTWARRSTPDISGMRWSVTTTWAGCFSSTSSASVARLAHRTFISSARSRRWSALRMFTSSSTKRTVCSCRMAAGFLSSFVPGAAPGRGPAHERGVRARAARGRRGAAFPDPGHGRAARPRGGTRGDRVRYARRSNRDGLRSPSSLRGSPPPARLRFPARPPRGPAPRAEPADGVPMTIQPIRPELSLLDGRFYADDPHAHFLWMREHVPVYWDEQAEVWGITLHDDLQAVSKDSETFCNRFGMRPDAPAVPSMINFDGDVHKRRRNLVNRGFTPRRVAEHEAKIRTLCAALVENAKHKGCVDFVTEVAAPLPMIVIGDMLGVQPEDRDRLLRWSDDLISGLSLTAPPEAVAATAKAAMEYAAYCAGVIADRRSRVPADDLMSILVHGEIDGDRLDDEALVQESLLILVGGDETTRHVISGG